MYDIGDMTRLTGEFYNFDDEPADPSVIKLYIKAPPGYEEIIYTYGTDPVIVRTGPGVFRADLELEYSGLYYYRWEGTGAVTSAEEGKFFVRGSKFIE